MSSMRPRPAVLVAALAILTALAGPLARPAAAQQVLTAAALVNDTVISVLDLEMRVRLALLSAGLPRNNQQRQRVAPQVMRTLIDETLQRQEAEQLGYSVSQQELDRAVAEIAGNNNMSADRFISVLEGNDVLPGVFFDQLRAQIAWQKILQNKLRPQIEISDAQVEEVVERLRARQGETEYRVREIFLSIDRDAEANQVAQTARRLVQELRRGAEFAALARQFSQSATAAVGGEVGWVLPDNLPEPVADAVQDLDPGQVAGPLRGFSGIYIVKLADRRTRSIGDRTIELKQLFHPIPDDAGETGRAQARQRLQELAAQVESCEGVEELPEPDGPVSASDLGPVQVKQLPDTVRRELADVEVGAPSAPLEVRGGLAVIAVCGRSEDGIDRERIRERLTRDRLEMLAQRYMRDLRRQAHVDIRTARAQR